MDSEAGARRRGAVGPQTGEVADGADRPEPVRIGVLGAARIVKGALLEPAGQVTGVRVAALAARDVDRARAWADRHGIGRVLPTYEALVADGDIDAIYVPQPAALHARWTTAAIRAGRHVLCEKPFTSNAADAAAVAEVAAGSDRVVMEAYHSRYHPMLARLREILASGELGTVHSARAWFCVPIPPGRDIRWNLALGGGGLLDVGYYPVRMLRDLFGPEPSVRSARAWERGGVDRLVEAELDFPGIETGGDRAAGPIPAHDGVRATVVSSMWSRRVFGMGLDVVGTRGRLHVPAPYHPQMNDRIGIRATVGGKDKRIERVGKRSTYIWQLEAFRDAVRTGSTPPTDAAAAVTQMRVLDAIYAAAGMQTRP